MVNIGRTAVTIGLLGTGGDSRSHGRRTPFTPVLWDSRSSQSRSRHSGRMKGGCSSRSRGTPAVFPRFLSPTPMQNSTADMCAVITTVSQLTSWRQWRTDKGHSCSKTKTIQTALHPLVNKHLTLNTFTDTNEKLDDEDHDSAMSDGALC